MSPGAGGRPDGPAGPDAVVLAGGRGRRLGGVDKARIVVDGLPLLAHALAAVDAGRTAAGQRTVVVGPSPTGPDALAPHVLVTREDPPHGGPAAALAAGLDALRASGATGTTVLVLAVDLPAVRRAVPVLRDAVGASGRPLRDAAGHGGPDGWVAVDRQGRRQPLLAVWRTAALRRAVSALLAGRGSLDGAPLHALLAPLRPVEVPMPDDLVADVDTPEQAVAHGATVPTRGGTS